jgi:hypothetical protein
MFDEPTCESLNGAGFPCGMRPMVGERWCWSHSPDKRAAANDARRKGGSHSRGAATSPAPDDVDVASLPGRMELVELGVRDTLMQQNTPARSRALAALLRLAHDFDVQAEEALIAEQLQELHRLVEERERENRGY